MFLNSILVLLHGIDQESWCMLGSQVMHIIHHHASPVVLLHYSSLSNLICPFSSPMVARVDYMLDNGLTQRMNGPWNMLYLIVIRCMTKHSLEKNSTTYCDIRHKVCSFYQCCSRATDINNNSFIETKILSLRWKSKDSPVDENNDIGLFHQWSSSLIQI